MKGIGEEKLGFNYTLNEWMDHISIISWINLMAHRTAIGKELVNIEGRPWVELPSGKKIVITIKIEEYKENV